MSIRVFLADDHRIMREGLRRLLEQESDINVVGEASDGYSTIEMVKKLKPHIVMMDITMPDLNGIDATHRIAHDMPDVRILALSMHDEPEFVERIIRAGAQGYLTKDSDGVEVIEAVHILFNGETYLSPEIADMLRRDYIRQWQVSNISVFSVLTGKEREILQLVSEGKTTKEIASHLEISAKTVATHRDHIMKKLNLYSVAQLTKYAIREGLTSL